MTGWKGCVLTEDGRSQVCFSSRTKSAWLRSCFGMPCDVYGSNRLYLVWIQYCVSCFALSLNKFWRQNPCATFNELVCTFSFEIFCSEIVRVCISVVRVDSHRLRLKN